MRGKERPVRSILARKSLTVLARVGSGNIAAVCFYDDLSAAEGEGGIKFLADNVVPLGAQIVDQRRVSAGFDADPAAGIDPPARCIGVRLRVLAIAEHPTCRLRSEEHPSEPQYTMHSSSN